MAEAGCACGQLKAAWPGEPQKVSLCYCGQCRKRTGSAFGMAAFLPIGEMTVSGEARTHTRLADNGFDVTFHFCPVCGTSLWWEPSRKPGMVGVAAGAIAGPLTPAPTQEAYVEGRPSWLRITLDPDPARA